MKNIEKRVHAHTKFCLVLPRFKPVSRFPDARWISWFECIRRQRLNIGSLRLRSDWIRCRRCNRLGVSCRNFRQLETTSWGITRLSGISSWNIRSSRRFECISPVILKNENVTIFYICWQANIVLTLWLRKEPSTSMVCIWLRQNLFGVGGCGIQTECT